MNLCSGSSSYVLTLHSLVSALEAVMPPCVLHVQRLQTQDGELVNGGGRLGRDGCRAACVQARLSATYGEHVGSRHRASLSDGLPLEAAYVPSPAPPIRSERLCCSPPPPGSPDGRLHP